MPPTLSRSSQSRLGAPVRLLKRLRVPRAAIPPVLGFLAVLTFILVRTDVLKDGPGLAAFEIEPRSAT